MTKYILAIDQGTTSTRALVFDEELSIVSTDQKSSNNIFRILDGLNMTPKISGRRH